MAKIPVKTVKNGEAEQQPNDKHVSEIQDATTETPDGEDLNDLRENAGEESGEMLSPETDDVESCDDAQPVEDAPENEEVEEEEIEEEDEVSRLKKALDAKECEVKEHYEARLRLQAEFDNFKKRKEKETFDFRKYANQSFIKELLIIVDDFERAIAAAEQSHKLEDFLKGVEMIFSKFLGELKKKGVKEIEAQGQPFNPEIHEAVTQIATDDMEEGTVAAVFQKGYYLHERVILAPKVGVAKPTEE